MALYGGVQIMTSTGDPEKLRRGRNILFYAAVGFVVVVLAKGIPALIQGVFNH